MVDTWQAMCHNAWQRPTHVGHMACHVSTCMAHLKAINMVLFVEGGSNKRENEGKKKERERKRGKEKREREGEGEKGKNQQVFLRSTMLRWKKIIRPRSKVRLRDDSYA